MLMGTSINTRYAKTSFLCLLSACAIMRHPFHWLFGSRIDSIHHIHSAALNTERDLLICKIVFRASLRVRRRVRNFITLGQLFFISSTLIHARGVCCVPFYLFGPRNGLLPAFVFIKKAGWVMETQHYAARWFIRGENIKKKRCKLGLVNLPMTHLSMLLWCITYLVPSVESWQRAI